MPHADIPGYDYGSPDLEDSPLTEAEFSYLRRTVNFTHDDREYLEMAGEVLEDNLDEIVGVWYDFVADNDFLLAYFSTPDGEPNEEYLQRVRPRFARWIEDTCHRQYDQEWLDYMHEIGRRHTYDKKNETDQVEAAPHIPLRYVIGFVYPVTRTINEFLAESDHSDQAIERMSEAWLKSVLMQAALWSAPYTRDGWF